MPEAGNKDGSTHLLCQFMQHSGSSGHTPEGGTPLHRAPLTTSSLSGNVVRPSPRSRQIPNFSKDAHDDWMEDE